MGKQFLEITQKTEVDAIVAQIGAAVARVRVERGVGGAYVEKVGISAILSRIASSNIFSAIDVPQFDRAIMDGYAVVASDTFYTDETNPTSLIIKGYLSSGESPAISQSVDVERSYCIGISTGAPIPKGANAVVKVEDTYEYTDDSGPGEIKKVKVYRPVAPGENIMLASSDIKRGEQIIMCGTTFTPRETGILAACGINEVDVRKKPVVAIISTGNELIAPGEVLAPAKIYDVNAQTLSDSVRECGCIPHFVGIARDNIKAISLKLTESLENGADVIIATGGTSAGLGDLLLKAIEERADGESKILVHGVDIKPGKPFIFGLLTGKPFFGLPGNPTSALITFSLFVAPLLRTISGTEKIEYNKNRIEAKAAQRIFSEPGRNEYVLVNIAIVPGQNSAEMPEKPSFLAYPILTGSGAITTLSKADGYIFMEKGKEIIEKGEDVEVELFKPFNFYRSNREPQNFEPE